MHLLTSNSFSGALGAARLRTGGTQTYIGGHRNASYSPFYWVDGTTPFSAPWAAMEPGGTETVVALWSSASGIYDYGNETSYTFRYLCEFEFSCSPGFECPSGLDQMVSP